MNEIKMINSMDGYEQKKIWIVGWLDGGDSNVMDEIGLTSRWFGKLSK